ncbi:MAG: DUF11 domain-containing protein [Anaerolineae bacterium]|nr:DUF11 domain-containing protein [Anaerolineae bacterium]
MKTYEKVRARPMALVLMAVGLALSLVTVLSLSLSARAEPTADPQLDKQVNTDQAGPGDILTYTIYVENTTPDTIDAWITDTLPTEVDYVGGLQWLGAGDASYADGVITWTCDSFPWGTKALITFTVQISPNLDSATVVNTAEFTGSGRLITSTVSTGVSPGELGVLKTIDSPTVRPGDPVLYTVYISNTGYGAVDPFSMTDDLPQELVNIGAPSVAGGTGASCGEGGGVVTCTGRLDPSGMVTVTFSADVSPTLEAGKYFTNTVTVTGAGLPISDSVEAMVKTDYEYVFPIIFLNYPPVPVLNSIPVPVGGTYNVSWDCDSTYVDYYELQEATDDDFTQNVKVYATTALSYYFDKGSTLDNWYYRVRAIGDWGEGGWSNSKEVSTGFYDSFDDSGSGWLDEEGVMYVDQYGVRHEWKRDYKSGQYRLKVEQGGPFAWFWHPAAWAPYKPDTDKYCIETNVKFAEGNVWANMGVIMGSSDDDRDKMELYAFCLGRDDESGLGWFLMHKDNYKFPSENSKERGGCSQPTGDKIEGFAKAGGGVRDGTSKEGWNRVRLGVDGDKVKVYIGDHYKGEAGIDSDEKKVLSGLNDMKYVGVIGGDYELTPIDIRYDYFKVTLNSDCNY